MNINILITLSLSGEARSKRPPLVRQNSVSLGSFGTFAMSLPVNTPVTTTLVGQQSTTNHPPVMIGDRIGSLESIVMQKIPTPEGDTKTVMAKNHQGQEIKIKIKLTKPTTGTTTATTPVIPGYSVTPAAADKVSIKNPSPIAQKQPASDVPGSVFTCLKCQTVFNDDIALSHHSAYVCKKALQTNTYQAGPSKSLDSSNIVQLFPSDGKSSDSAVKNVPLASNQPSTVVKLSHADTYPLTLISPAGSSLPYTPTGSTPSATAVRPIYASTPIKSLDSNPVYILSPENVKDVSPGTQKMLTPSSVQEMSIFPPKKGRPKGIKNRSKDSITPVKDVQSPQTAMFMNMDFYKRVVQSTPISGYSFTVIAT